MSAINTRVVHRSNALAGHAYGREFRYDEALLTGRGVRGRLTATATGAGLGAFMLAGSVGPLRAALEKFVLPAPGEGPSPEQQRKGGFDLRFHGRCANGQVIRARVTGDRDPGYGSTAKNAGAGGRMPRARTSRDQGSAAGSGHPPRPLATSWSRGSRPTPA